MCCRRVLRLACCWAFLLAGYLTASAADLSQEVSEMLDHAWKPSFKGLKTAAVQYQELHDQHPSDIRIKFAYSLLLVRNHKYDDALKLLNEVLSTQGGCLPARQARLWIRMLKKDYEAALVDMEAILVALPADRTTPQEPQWLEHCTFLGSMTGFLAGPAAVPEVRLMPLRAKVNAALVDARLTAFANAESGVERKFAKYTESIEKVQTADHEKAVAYKEEMRRLVARDQEVASTDRANFQGEVNQVSAQAVRDYAGWCDQVSAAQQSYMAAQRWMNFLASISGGGYCHDDDDDRHHHHYSSSRGSHHHHHHRSAGTGMAMVGTQIASDNAVNRLYHLQNMYGVVASYYSAYRQRLSEREKPLLKEERRLSLMERTLAQPIPVTSVRSRTLTMTSKSVTSYHSLPYERLRLQLAASLQTKK